MIVINGSYGEGGGQVLRTSLTLSALSGEPLRIENIRAKRRKPGLQAQHLTGVRAMAQICDAELEGADLGSLTLAFRPLSSPRAGEYSFDVAEARKGGSAGATSLVFQTLLLPLAFAPGESRLTIPLIGRFLDSFLERGMLKNTDWTMRQVEMRHAKKEATAT